MDSKQLILRMKKSDRFAYEYLAHRGFDDIVYEPDRNQTPDFLVEGRIAVEARRLNQNEAFAEGYRGLEELRTPLNALVKKVIGFTIDLPSAGESWFVVYAFRRPLPPWKELERLIAVALRSFRDQSNHQPGMVRVTANFKLEFYRASSVHPTFFVFGGSRDSDSGGFVMGETVRNLRICIAEKTRKAAKFRSKYPEWWLVLEDRIGYGDWNESDRSQLRELVQLDGGWDKIIVVSHLNHAIGFEL